MSAGKSALLKIALRDPAPVEQILPIDQLVVFTIEHRQRGVVTRLRREKQLAGQQQIGTEQRQIVIDQRAVADERLIQYSPAQSASARGILSNWLWRARKGDELAEMINCSGGWGSAIANASATRPPRLWPKKISGLSCSGCSAGIS